MKYKTIVACGGSTSRGLGNKLTAICGGYAAAKIRGCTFVAMWEPGPGCAAQWSHLFKPPSLFEFVNQPPIGALRHQAPSYMPCRQDAHYATMGSEEFTMEYWKAWQECAKSFQLIDELALPPKRDFIAVSIRGNFKKRSATSGWWVGKSLPPGSFICSDSKEQFAHAVSICEKAWWLSHPKTNVDLENRDVTGIQAAARDMMMLCHARLILAVGHRSTLRNIPVLGYGVPIFKLDEGPNP